jgi:uncharacterized membrane protein
MWWRWLWQHILERFWLWIWLWRRMWYVSLYSFRFFFFFAFLMVLTVSQAVAVVVVVPSAFLAVGLAVEEAVVCSSIFVLSLLTHDQEVADVVGGTNRKHGEIYSQCSDFILLILYSTKLIRLKRESQLLAFNS